MVSHQYTLVELLVVVQQNMKLSLGKLDYKNTGEQFAEAQLYHHIGYWQLVIVLWMLEAAA